MRTCLALALASVALLALPGSGDATSSKRRSCGTIRSTSVYPYARVVAIRRVTCRRAREIAKAYDSSGRAARGWRCALAHRDRPRLFSCGSGGKSGGLQTWPRALEAIGTRRASGGSG